MDKIVARNVPFWEIFLLSLKSIKNQKIHSIVDISKKNNTTAKFIDMKFNESS